jgi:hypothetical protein
MIAPSLAGQIILTFTEFQTGSGYYYYGYYRYDYVRVYQCYDVGCSSAYELAALAGTYGSIQAVTSPTGFMKVVLYASGYYSLPGFTASWTSSVSFYNISHVPKDCPYILSLHVIRIELFS